MCVCTHKQTNTNNHSYRHRKPQQISGEWANKYVHKEKFNHFGSSNLNI